MKKIRIREHDMKLLLKGSLKHVETDVLKWGIGIESLDCVGSFFAAKSQPQAGHPIIFTETDST